jgi:hypothetical protein
MIKENNPTILQPICVAMMKLDKAPKNRDNAIDAAAVEADDNSYSLKESFMFFVCSNRVRNSGKLKTSDKGLSYCHGDAIIAFKS